jgi:diketogulonate reductase-like aldo/keto reductase
MKTLKLTDNITIPQMGFGTYGLRNGEDIILHALRTGYRHLDSADLYRSHGDCGRALRKSGLKREDVFITTKLWSNSVADDQVRPAVDRFLGELEMDYIDLLLIHWPSKSVPVAETLGAMDRARQAGKVRAVGVSNFSVADMKEALASGVPVSNNQIEYNIEERPDDIVEFCLAKGITVTAYSPVKTQGSGEDKKKVAEIAKQHGSSPEEVLLAWLMAKGLIVIPRSSNPKHVESNYRSVDLQLSAEELASLA